MSQFFSKYRDLFMGQNSSQNYMKSYLRPYIGQMKHRVHSLNLMNNSYAYTPKVKQHKTNQFQSQILPELKRLNQESNKHKRYKELQPLDHFVKYENSNKNIKLEPLKIENKSDNYVKKLNPIRNLSTYKNDYAHNRQLITRNYSNIIDYTPNPQQLPIYSPNKQKTKTKYLWRRKYNQSARKYQKIKTQIQQKIQQCNLYKYRYKTQNNEIKQIKDDQIYLLNLDKSRKDYGYPQVNYGLIFDQYERNNQFKFINKKLKDIKWLQKYYPRGSLNYYRQALIRRNQRKKNMQQRRKQLKKVLQDEQQQYAKNKSII